MCVCVCKNLDTVFMCYSLNSFQPRGFFSYRMKMYFQLRASPLVVGKQFFSYFTTSNSNLVSNIGGAKGKFVCLFATMTCQDQQFTIERRHKKKIYHLVRFRGREEERKKLIKKEQCLGGGKIKTVDVECVVKLCIKIDKIVF